MRQYRLTVLEDYDPTRLFTGEIARLNSLKVGRNALFSLSLVTAENTNVMHILADDITTKGLWAMCSLQCAEKIKELLLCLYCSLLIFILKVSIIFNYFFVICLT